MVTYHGNSKTYSKLYVFYNQYLIYITSHKYCIYVVLQYLIGDSCDLLIFAKIVGNNVSVE